MFGHHTKICGSEGKGEGTFGLKQLCISHVCPIRVVFNFFSSLILIFMYFNHFSIDCLFLLSLVFRMVHIFGHFSNVCKRFIAWQLLVNNSIFAHLNCFQSYLFCILSQLWFLSALSQQNLTLKKLLKLHCQSALHVLPNDQRIKLVLY